jgi:hypothetical protein
MQSFIRRALLKKLLIRQKERWFLLSRDLHEEALSLVPSLLPEDGRAAMIIDGHYKAEIPPGDLAYEADFRDVYKQPCFRIPSDWIERPVKDVSSDTSFVTITLKDDRSVGEENNSNNDQEEDFVCLESFQLSQLSESPSHSLTEVHVVTKDDELISSPVLSSSEEGENVPSGSSPPLQLAMSPIFSIDIAADPVIESRTEISIQKSINIPNIVIEDNECKNECENECENECGYEFDNENECEIDLERLKYEIIWLRQALESRKKVFNPVNLSII